MKVFTFKKVHFILVVGLIIFVCGIIIASLGGVVETNSTPATNKTVILDAGHGVPDEGAFLLHKENKQLTFYK